MIALQEIYRPIQHSLMSVEEQLMQMDGAEIDVFAKGRRLRPALLLFSAHAFNGADHRNATLVATAIEMIHAASLIHDDLIDGTSERRQRPSLHMTLGSKRAVIYADFLFAQGLTLLDSVKPSSITSLVINAIRTMCEGQWMELVMTKQNFSTQNYLTTIEKKTASLFACCCKVGGIIRSAQPQELATLGDFGKDFGLTYQLLDDAEDMSFDDAGGVERKLIECGGRAYCEQLARDTTKQAGTRIADLPNDIERKAFEQMLSYIWGGKYAQ